MNRKFLFALCLFPAFARASSDAYMNYLQGMAEEHAGHPAKALEAYEKVVQEDPQALQVYRDIAELRLRLGQPEAALTAAERVKDLAPTDPSSFIFIGNIFVAQGNLAKAAEAYEKALKIDPTNLRALENLGNYYALLDPDKALSYYQRYLEQNPRDADIYFQMALVYQKRGNQTQALVFYKKSLQWDDQQIASHLAIADLYEQQKSTAAAIEEYKAAAPLQPSNALIFLRLGNLYYHDGKWDDAQQAFKAAQALTPQDPTAYYWLARVAEEKKSWKEAAASAEKAYELSQDPQFLPLAAYYLTLDRQIESAVKYLDKAQQAAPDSANVLLFLGMNYLDLDKPEKAHEYLTKGVSLYPKDTQMRFQLAISEDRLGHFDASVKEFQNLLAMDPKNSAALNYLGYSWADRGVRLEEAEKMLRRAVSAEPDSGAYLDSLGWVRLKRGAATEAKSLLEKAVLLSPDPLIYDHLGDAYMADHHPEAALQSWSKAIGMDPKNETVRKKLKEAGDAFFHSPDAGRYVKYLEGNFKQAQTLSSDVVFSGKLNRHALHAEGKLYYAQPDRSRLEVAGSGKSGPMRFILEGDKRKVEPDAPSPALAQIAFNGMNVVSQFLSGQLTSILKAGIDPQTGVTLRFSKPNASGGQDVIDVVSYDFVEGLWLPSHMRIHNATTGWEADLTFAGWVVNDPHFSFSAK